MNRFETGWKMKSKDPSAKAERSRMSPSTSLSSSPSRSATNLSWSSWRGELSNTVTFPPAAASTGPCCPPPLARQSISNPFSAGNHSRGTVFFSVRRIEKSPLRALAMTSGETGLVHSISPSSTYLFHASRLYPRISMISPRFLP